MKHNGDVRSAWDTSTRGPARRVYALTAEGRRLLANALAGMEEHSLTITRLLRHAQACTAAAPARQGVAT